MRKILSFTDYYWPGYKAGGTIRAFMNQVDYLKDEFEFFIVTRNTDYTETEPYPGIEPNRWTDLSPSVHVYYVSAEAQRVGLFRRLISERPYDVVYIHLLFGFWFSLLPVILSKLNRCRCIIVAPHGNLGSGALNVKPLKKKIFLRFMKWIGLYAGTIFHSVTDHETEDIKKHIGKGAKIAEARELPRKITQPPVRTPKKAGELRMVTIARISPEKNQLFALEILSGIKDHMVQYDIIGPVNDENYWSRCRNLIDAMPHNIRVNYRGSINSELILNELQHYDVMMLPTTGENFGHTILESFMAGCPVIISDQTPWKKLAEGGTGFDIPLNDRETFRKSIGFFASMDHEEFKVYSDNAYKFAMGWCANPGMLAENINLFRC